MPGNLFQERSRIPATSVRAASESPYRSGISANEPCVKERIRLKQASNGAFMQDESSEREKDY